MTDTDIRIEKIKTKDLVEFAKRFIASAKEGQFIPITLQRAVSHANNPVSDPEDVSLLLAYQGEELVGFFGIMPILLKYYDRLEKVFWFSTWRVTPQVRGKFVGSLLMQAALTLDQDFMIVGSGPARRVCRKFGFKERPPLVYYQLDLTGMANLNPAVWLSRFVRRILHPFKVKVAIENVLTRLTGRVLSPVTRRIFSPLMWRKQQSLLAQIRLAEVDEVKAENAEQLAGLAPVQFYRGASLVNWMLKYPWIVQPGKSPTEKMDFYFGDVRQRFHSAAVEVYTPADTYAGYIVFQVSTTRQQTELKVLDIALISQAFEGYLLPIALHLARKQQADLIFLPEEAISNFRATQLGKMLVTRRERIYQCSVKSDDSHLARAWAEIRFNFCDGDMPFS